MSMHYKSYTFTVHPKEPATEILIAQLGLVGFESFVEHEQGVSAYIQVSDWFPEILEDIQILGSDAFEIHYTEALIEQTNWNREWEKNFQAIQVADLVSVRAPFHEPAGLAYDIVIEPKMSFGTGHHETTHMMIQQLLSLDLSGKKVLDMGCGTGILAIFSEMRGAASIDAIDIDHWCYENALENVARNNCQKIAVFEGDASLLKAKKYEVIIANINRNILLQDMAIYRSCLSEKGVLLLSGFYREDIPLIDRELSGHAYQMAVCIERNDWVCLQYIK